LATTIQTATAAAITALGAASIDRTNVSGSDLGTLYRQLYLAGLQEEAEGIRLLWARLRAVLDQAHAKATTLGL